MTCKIEKLHKKIDHIISKHGMIYEMVKPYFTIEQINKAIIINADSLVEAVKNKDQAIEKVNHMIGMDVPILFGYHDTTKLYKYAKKWAELVLEERQQQVAQPESLPLETPASNISSN